MILRKVCKCVNVTCTALLRNYLFFVEIYRMQVKSIRSNGQNTLENCRKEVFIWMKPYQKPVSSITNAIYQNVQNMKRLKTKILFSSRIWKVQLFYYHNFGCDSVFCNNGVMWHRLYTTCLLVWIRIVTESKRHFSISCILRHHMLIAFMGILSWYKGSTLCNTANFIDHIFIVRLLVVH